MPDSPFIVSQKLWLWKRPVAEFFGRLPGVVQEREQWRWERNQSSSDARSDEVWTRLPREALVRGVLEDQRLDRLVLVVDSGMGKSKNLEWLQYRLSLPDEANVPSPYVALLLDVDDLPEHPASDEQLLRHLWLAGCRSCPTLNECERFKSDEPAALEWIRRLRRAGKLVLLIDAIDQAQGAKLDTLKWWLGNAGAFVSASSAPVTSEWQRCRFVATGRPFAIQDKRFQDLLGDTSRDWRCVEIDPFTEAEQRVVLGRFPDGTERWDQVPREARPLLSTPRVCEYLLKLPVEKWLKLRTVSDVYFESLRYQVQEGLKAIGARDFGSGPGDLDRQIEEVLQFLGALAFEMIAGGDTTSGTLRHRVPRDDHHREEYEGYLKQVRARLQASFEWPDKKAFGRDWDALKAVNAAKSVEFWFLEETRQHVVQFHDATVKEFLAAYWVAKHGTAEDARRVESEVYLPPRRRPDEEVWKSAEFAWFWRYLCEMPTGGRLQESWLRAISPLYGRHVFGLPVRNACYYSRSCEMMYRAWKTLQAYSEQGNAQAKKIVEDFLGEFPAILNGDDLDRAKIAAELVPEPMLKKSVSSKRFQEICPSATAPAYVRCPPQGATGRFWRGTAADACSRDDEMPRHEVELTSFWFKATHVTRQEFALFDPSHDIAWMGTLDSCAPQPDCPVLYVSWYEGWCLALWSGMSLPTEAQFEFAVRAGHDGPLDLYPFSPWDTASSFQINFDGRYPFAGPEGPYLGQTVPVRCEQPCDDGKPIPKVRYAPNEWGVWHPVGQAWVWCDNWYDADEYSRYAAHGRVVDPARSASGTERVLRGGAWNYYPALCRSAFRYGEAPEYRDNYTGLRLVCVGCVRTS